MEAKKLNALIGKIGKASKTLRDDIQAALVGCAYQVAVHRNSDPFNRLLGAVGKGTRLEGMLKWASLYAPIRFKDEKIIVDDKRQKGMLNTLLPEQIQAGLDEAPMWYDMAPNEPVANPWDSVGFARGIATYLMTAAKKAEKNGDAVLSEELFKLHNELAIATNNLEYEVVTEVIEVEVPTQA